MMIRPAEPSDAPAIAAIWNHYIRVSVATFNAQEKSVQEVADSIAGNPGFWVARSNQVIGFATYFQFRGGVGYARTMEHTVQIAPDGCGSGTGRALMAALLDHAKQAGAHSMFAGVSAENDEGVRFHDRLGFETVARLPEVGFKFGRWMDLILMQKRL